MSGLPKRNSSPMAGQIERFPILVTGCARSGTSMIAGTINICGAFGGKTIGATRWNAKGQFENARVRDQVTKPYLRELGVDPLGQWPLPDLDRLTIPVDWRHRVERVFLEDGYKGGPWFYKGAKMCLFWPVWHYAFPSARWVIVRRKREDIVSSCMKTSFMRAFRDPKIRKAVGAHTEADGWGWWHNQHLKRFREMQDAGLNCHVIWPERMVRRDYQDLYGLIDWLGLRWDSRVLEFIDPKLFHSRRRLEGAT